MDFGIARAVTASTATMTQTASVIGTAQYLSPEQARGDHVDARSDIYSTGCLLYELLTGTPPFTGDSAVAVAYQHVREEPVAPSVLEPDVSPALDAIVLKAMAKNPANRYDSAEDMRDDIERALAGRPVEARPVVMEPRAVVAPPPPTTVLLRRPEPNRGRRAAAYTLLGLAVVAVFLVGRAGGTCRRVGTRQHRHQHTDVTGKAWRRPSRSSPRRGCSVGNRTQTFDPEPEGHRAQPEPAARNPARQG